MEVISLWFLTMGTTECVKLIKRKRTAVHWNHQETLQVIPSHWRSGSTNNTFTTAGGLGLGLGFNCEIYMLNIVF